jgi:hypothetical protein
VQAEYRNFYVAEWIQLPTLSPTRAVALVITSEGSTFPTTVPSGTKDHGIVMSASRTTLPAGSSVAGARLAPVLPVHP